MDGVTTIAELAFHVAGRFPAAPVLGRASAGGVIDVTGRELLDRVRDLSLGLSSLGMARGDRVAVLAESRPEWLLTDLAILSAGAVSVPIYPTLSAEQVRFILRDSGATLTVASTSVQAQKIQSMAAGLPTLRAICVFDAGVAAAASGPAVHTLADVEALGHRQILDGRGVAKVFQDTARAIEPGAQATIIYTSGTTAEPKGVVLTHGNLASNIAGVQAVLRLRDTDVALSFLPLCHAFERMVAYVYLAHGVSMVFAESIDTLARDIGQVRPTIMTGVPRVFEKLQARILEKGKAAGGLKARIFSWAVGVAQAGSRANRLTAALADRLVFKQIREGLGGRFRFVVSGSAPLREDVAKFFHGIGIPVVEGYGLTETSPVLTVMPLEAIRFGSVGRALPDVTLRIADDGEILARGPNVMTGYHGRPEETAAAFREGWFATGDLGTLDAEGYLRITGRKKELLVTSGGKKIVPHVIEALLKSDPLVAEAVLIAEQRHFPSALLVPDVAALSRALGSAVPGTPATTADFLRRPDVLARYQAVVDAANVSLAQFERVKQFRLLPAPFSIESGELTPTLKVKRRVVEEKYAAQIADIYGG